MISPLRRRRYPVTPILPVVNHRALTLDESYLRKLKRDGLKHLYTHAQVQGATVLQDERGSRFIQLTDYVVSSLQDACYGRRHGLIAVGRYVIGQLA